MPLKSLVIAAFAELSDVFLWSSLNADVAYPDSQMPSSVRSTCHTSTPVGTVSFPFHSQATPQDPPPAPIRRSPSHSCLGRLRFSAWRTTTDRRAEPLRRARVRSSPQRRSPAPDPVSRNTITDKGRIAQRGEDAPVATGADLWAGHGTFERMSSGCPGADHPISRVKAPFTSSSWILVRPTDCYCIRSPYPCYACGTCVIWLRETRSCPDGDIGSRRATCARLPDSTYTASVPSAKNASVPR